MIRYFKCNIHGYIDSFKEENGRIYYYCKFDKKYVETIVCPNRRLKFLEIIQNEGI